VHSHAERGNEGVLDWFDASLPARATSTVRVRVACHFGRACWRTSKTAGAVAGEGCGYNRLVCNARKNFQAILTRLRRGVASYILTAVSPNFKVVNILPRLKDAEQGFFDGMCRLGTPVALRGLSSAAEVPDLIFYL
jgi:hypothetical protein